METVTKEEKNQVTTAEKVQRGRKKGAKEELATRIYVGDKEPYLVIQALYDNAVVRGMKAVSKYPKSLSDENAKDMAKANKPIYFFDGRVMGGFDPSKKYFEPYTYNSHNIIKAGTIIAGLAKKPGTVDKVET